MKQERLQTNRLLSFRPLCSKRKASRCLNLGILLFFLFGSTAYADPRPSPEQNVAVFSGAGLALVCEVLVVLFAVQRYRYRAVPLGLCLYFINVLFYTCAFETPFFDLLQQVTRAPGRTVLLVVELGIVVFEAAALFYLVRFPFVRSSHSTNISFMAAVMVSCIGNLTSYVTGWFFIRSFMWFYWRSLGLGSGGYFHYLLQ